MIILITGPSHTGKTSLAQKMLEKLHFPYLSIDHLKMGLIRSGQTSLTPFSSDAELTAYLWPILREIIKTSIENNQNLIIEGCYIPVNWKQDFSISQQSAIRCIRLILSEHYIRSHFNDIKSYANVIEQRLDDSYCTPESVLRDNQEALQLCMQYGEDYFLIDTCYNLDALLT